MAPFTSLLVVTDFSAAGHHAVRRAALLAQAHGARLHILHLLEAPHGMGLRRWLSPLAGQGLGAADALGELRRFAVELSASCDLTPTVEVASGDPAEILGQSAARSDLVVIGHRGHRLPRWIRACGSPVLVVKTPAGQPYGRVLVPIDFTAGSDAALRLAARMQRDAALHLLHVLDGRREAVLRDADVPEHVIRETRLLQEAGAHARMRRRVSGLGLDGLQVDLALAHGPVARSTLSHARRTGIDLIVAGRPDRSTVAEWLLGSLSGRLLAGAGCDVLVVPETRPEPRPRVHAASSHWIHGSARFLPRRSDQPARPALDRPEGPVAAGVPPAKPRHAGAEGLTR